jgi:hypothetical protein
MTSLAPPFEFRANATPSNGGQVISGTLNIRSGDSYPNQRFF